MNRTHSIQNILERMEPIAESGCLVWCGFIDKNGYGQISVKGKTKLVHRVVWEMSVGSIPKNLQIDHLCRVRSCGNIAHMELVTGRINVLRGNAPSSINVRKTMCLRGHMLSPDNTRATARSPNSRNCKICQRERLREWRARHRTKPVWVIPAKEQEEE